MLEHLLIPVQTELKVVESVFATQLDSNVPLITTAAQYVTQNGGKRIRPAIFLLAAKLAGGLNEKISNLAAGIELVHTASLLHDDVIDDSRLRRGKPSAKIKWGNQVSVLLGDFLWCKASEIFIGNGTNRFWHVMMNAITAITEGQILEVTHLNNVELNTDGYNKIILGKTASLFGVCGQGAAIVQNLSDKFEMALREYGLNIGIAFQLTDDVLDYTSKDSVIGKEAGVDLREGKLTLPVIIALKKCDQTESRKIKDCLISGQLSKEQFSEAVEIINRHGGISETMSSACEYARKAKDCLSIFKPSIERDALLGIADYIIDRKE